MLGLLVRSDRNPRINSKQKGFHYCFIGSKELNLPARENAEMPWNWDQGFSSVVLNSCCLFLLLWSASLLLVSSFLSPKTNFPPLYYFARAAVTKRHTLRGLNSRKLLSHSSGSQKFRIKAWAGPHSLKREGAVQASLLASCSSLAYGSRAPIATRHSPHVRVCLCVQIFLFIRTPVILE